MFSYEIERLIKNNNYNISSIDYQDICQSSTQIARLKYDPFENVYELWTNDNYYFKFKVYYKERK